MLVLSRHVSEVIVIGHPGPQQIRIMLVDVQGTNKARIGIDAPFDVPIHREEIYDKIQEGFREKRNK